jgi:flagellar biosynthesis protein FlhA
MGSILEAMVETAAVNKNQIALVEAARHALGRRLIQPLLDSDGQLPVLLLDPALEDEILGLLSQDSGAVQRQLAGSNRASAPLIRRLADSLRQLISAAPATALPVLLAPSPARYHIKRWIEPWVPRMAVVAISDIPAELRLRHMGTVR